MNDSAKFVAVCQNEIRKYIQDHIDKTDTDFDINKVDIYTVWTCKTLQNSKALLSTNIHDGMYYECTYNGDRNQLYLDAYKKFENKEIQL